MRTVTLRFCAPFVGYMYPGSEVSTDEEDEDMFEGGERRVADSEDGNEEDQDQDQETVVDESPNIEDKYAPIVALLKGAENISTIAIPDFATLVLGQAPALVQSIAALKAISVLKLGGVEPSDTPLFQCMESTRTVTHIDLRGHPLSTGGRPFTTSMFRPLVDFQNLSALFVQVLDLTRDAPSFTLPRVHYFLVVTLYGNTAFLPVLFPSLKHLQVVHQATPAKQVSLQCTSLEHLEGWMHELLRMAPLFCATRRVDLKVYPPQPFSRSETEATALSIVDTTSPCVLSISSLKCPVSASFFKSLKARAPSLFYLSLGLSDNANCVRVHSAVLVLVVISLLTSNRLLDTRFRGDVLGLAAPLHLHRTGCKHHRWCRRRAPDRCQKASKPPLRVLCCHGSYAFSLAELQLLSTGPTWSCLRTWLFWCRPIRRRDGDWPLRGRDNSTGFPGGEC